MSSTDLHKFCRTALQSELLVPEQLEGAIATLRKADGLSGSSDAQGEIDRLGQQLIEMGYLNHWQVEQLKAGRTKFSLGPYQIIDSIGRGGMGHVFKGQHSMLGRIEAVKVLPKSHTSPESIERFQREIRAQAQLDHPNLVRVSYAGRDRDTYFFVTEFVSGADLRGLVHERTRLSMEEAATIVSQVAKALQYAHQRGLVHRDVKPGNVLVTPEGVAKLTDLGLAGFLLEDEYSESPHKGKIVGTADYLAPEAIRMPGEVSPLNDIYALGCTLYYAVTGKVPFPGGTTADKMQCHCDQMPINPQRFNPELSESFLDVIADMMAKEPEKRLQTADEVCQRLAFWVRSSVPEALGHLVEQASESQIVPPPLPTDTQMQFEDSRSGGSGSFSGEIFPQVTESESPSQASQGTEPILSASEETMPIPGQSPGGPAPTPKKKRRPRKPIPFAVWFVLILFSMIAIVAGVVWKFQ